ncbi:zinc knuckle CX2CX4HX4C containing protein, partial [Tanacetum coccineum]
VDDEVVKNDLASRIKNIDGRFLGRKVVRGVQFVADSSSSSETTTVHVYPRGKPHKSILKRDSNEGFAATNDDCTNEMSGSNSCEDTVLNQAEKSPDVYVQACEDPNGLSQVEDQGKDSRLSGKKDVNAWNTPFIKPLSSEQKKTIKIMELHNEEVVEGATVAIPLVAVEEVRNKFTNTLYGYFIWKRLAFMLVEKYVKNTWAKFGLEPVILQNGFFLFQLSTREGMDRVLENGSWLIRLVPLILNIWSPNTILKKGEITLASVWVKLHNMPIVAYSEIGLSLITTKMGHPLMLDTYTSDMCLNPWGRNTYARALIEVSVANALLDSIVVPNPLPNCKGHTLETIEIEYEWKPPRSEEEWSSNVKSTSHTTKDGDMPSTSRARTDLNTPMSNPFDVLSTVSQDTCGPGVQSPKVSEATGSGSLKSDDVKAPEEESLWTRFKNAKKASSQEQDSDEDEVFPLGDEYTTSRGGGFSMEDDILDCYDRYEAQVYNLSSKS